MPTPFCFDDSEQDELRYHIEDLRDRYEEMQYAADQLKDAIEEYNQQVRVARTFLEDKVVDCEDELYAARTEKFQKTPRGVRIAEWINELKAVLQKTATVELDISDKIDSDRENFADVLEDLEREA